MGRTMQTRTVTAVKSGPGESYAELEEFGKLGSLEEGELVRVVGRIGDWWEIKDYNYGFVRKSSLEPDKVIPGKNACRKIGEYFPTYDIDENKLNESDNLGYTLLTSAVSEKWEGGTKILLVCGANPNVRDKNGETPLCYSSDIHVVKALLSVGANHRVKCGKNQDTPLHRHAENGDVQVVKLLLSAGADPHAMNVSINYKGENEGRDRTPLHEAAENGHADVTELLLGAGANPNVRDTQGNAPLHEAAKNGHDDVAELLLNAGADSNARGAQRNTPLHQAVGKRRASMVKLLLSAGANPNSRDEGNLTPLKMASSDGQDELVQLMLDAGGNRNDLRDHTDLLFAAKRRPAAWVEELLAAGADPNVRDAADMTPLHWAAQRRNIDIVEALLDAGGNPNARDSEGALPLHKAIQGSFEFNNSSSSVGLRDTIEALLSAGINLQKTTYTKSEKFKNSEILRYTMVALSWGKLEERDKVAIGEAILAAGANPNGERLTPPLKYAVEDGDNAGALVKLLLDWGASPDLNPEFDIGNWRLGNTALHIAAELDNIEAVRILLNAGADPNGVKFGSERRPLDDTSDPTIESMLRAAGGITRWEAEW